MNWIGPAFLYFTYFILAYYAILYSSYLYLVFSSVYFALARPRRARLAASGLQFPATNVPAVTVLVPAHNEEATIVESVRALLGMDYPAFEVIIVNDGSTDGTLHGLIRSFSLHRADLVYEPLIPTRAVHGLYISTLDPRLLVVDKAQGGKSDALNAAINLVRTPWVCSVDADSILEQDALLRVMRPAMEDGRVVASSGVVRVANGSQVAAGRVTRVLLPHNWVEMMQVVEYLRGFLQGRLGWSWLNGLILVAGSFGVFRTNVLREIGGYSSETITEDLEIVVRIHRHLRFKREPYRIVFVEDPVCWTEVPASLSALSRQRRRWHRGMAETLWMHKDLLFNRRMGLVGFLVLPLYVLEMLSPLIELIGYAVVPLGAALGLVSREIFFLYLMLTFLLGSMLSLWAVLLEEYTFRRYNRWRDFARLVWFGIFEFPFTHPITVVWRVMGLYEFLVGRRDWGKQERVGFQRRRSSGRTP